MLNLLVSQFIRNGTAQKQKDKEKQIQPEFAINRFTVLIKVTCCCFAFLPEIKTATGWNRHKYLTIKASPRCLLQIIFRSHNDSLNISFCIQYERPHLLQVIHCVKQTEKMILLNKNVYTIFLLYVLIINAINQTSLPLLESVQSINVQINCLKSQL